MDSEASDEEITFLERGLAWQPVINYSAPVRSGFQLPSHATILDLTLTVADEIPGVDLTLSQRLRIAEKLEDAGVQELSVGFLNLTPQHMEQAKELKRLGTKMRLVGHTVSVTEVKDWRADVDRVAEAGCDIVCLIVSASKVFCEDVGWMPVEAVGERVAEATKYATSLGLVPALWTFDAPRTGLQSLRSVCSAAVEGGVKRVYVMDIHGVAMPETTSFLVRFLRDVVGPNVEIGVHCQNGFGLALANTLAGVKAGASVVDATINGYGEKSGFVSLDQIVMALHLMYRVPTGVKLDALAGLSELAEEAFGIPLSPMAPFLGKNVARNQVDAHMAMIMAGNWHAFDAVDPRLFGKKRLYEWSQHTVGGHRLYSIRAKIEAMGLSLSDTTCQEIEADVTAEIDRRGLLREEDIELIIRNYCE